MVAARPCPLVEGRRGDRSRTDFAPKGVGLRARASCKVRMTIDLTGGVDPSSDHFLAARPDDPQFRESASAWISDDAGLIGLPRIGIEAVAESWDMARCALGFTMRLRWHVRWSRAE